MVGSDSAGFKKRRPAYRSQGTALLRDGHRGKCVSRDDFLDVGRASSNVVCLQIRIVIQDGVRSQALRQKTEDQLHGDPHVADDRLAAEHIRPGCDSRE